MSSPKDLPARCFATFHRAFKTMGLGVENISEVYPDKLYLGTIAAASDLNLLTSLGITHVVTVTTFGKRAIFFRGHITYHVIDILDLSTESICEYLTDAVQFIENTMQCDTHCRILVHCVAGRSRSATVVLAYLMYHNNWNLDQALVFLRSKRPSVNPNSGFLKALRKISA